MISVDAQKVFYKIQHAFMIENLNKVKREETNLNIRMAIDDKPTVSIIFYGEK